MALDTGSQRQIRPQGVAHVHLEATSDTQRVSFVLLPQFSMLAFTAAIEPLRIANQLTDQQLYEWQTVSDDGGQITASNGLALQPQSSIAAEWEATTILVAGGTSPERTVSDTVAHWLRGRWRRGATVGGLCTGAYALARAGLLRGVPFTLHWENIPMFQECYPDLHPLERLVVDAGRIVTCGGGTSASDLMLSRIAKDHGIELTQVVADMCLHTWQREHDAPQRSTQLARLKVRHSKLARAIDFLQAELEEDDLIDAACAEVDVSRRQLERLFRRYIGQTPAQFLTELRLQRARGLLFSTNMKLREVAVASGFNSLSHFSKRFRQRFGHSPTQCTMRFGLD